MINRIAFVLAAVIVSSDFCFDGLNPGEQLRIIQIFCQHAVETLMDESSAAAGNINDLPDQVGIHPERKILQV